MDVAGEQQNGLVQDVTKTRLSADGEPVGIGIRSRKAVDTTKHDDDHHNDAERCNCFGAETEEIKVISGLATHLAACMAVSLSILNSRLCIWRTL